MDNKEFESKYNEWKALSGKEKKQAVKKLNESFLESFSKLQPKPQGKTNGGIKSSRSDAQYREKRLKLHDLQNNFNTIGWIINISPALLAGIGSRESNLGASLNDGWGDFSRRKGEAKPSFHGFGILQIDVNTGDVPKEILEELQKHRGKNSLDPSSIKWIRWGGEVLVRKLQQVREKYPNASPEEQLATAISRYNGGRGRRYPNSDKGTTGGDYASDTLVRAKYYAEHWSQYERH
ncbi:MAG: hypothetical protein K940chlam7_01964 [Chlamydiae bacterium]|nr:hypothetical protein [Chlamydiota bacterium]